MAQGALIGTRERAADALFWVRADRVPRCSPAGPRAASYRTAGDALAGGARRR
ncbi:hypothetical protein [Streptomyces sp. KR55]|uniref:hypothetical protein n=1 Tax=Streptomyces sp. KR55 TaxID=3457425 RepID=UPI003FD4D02A